jgi:hypothetical protein
MAALRFDLTSYVLAAQDGPLLAAKLIPLNNAGPLRVTYNWLYSALNCSPNDSSAFAWVISKIGAGPHVSLSPQVHYRGMTLYASVRPDHAMFVEVQAPFSADWITAVGSDETMTMTELGFLTIALQAFDGSYLTLNSSQTEHDGRSAYKLQSSVRSVSAASSFFVAVEKVLQPNLPVPLASGLDPEALKESLAASGAQNPAGLTQRILAGAS